MYKGQVALRLHRAGSDHPSDWSHYAQTVTSHSSGSGVFWKSQADSWEGII